ncbi:MAG: hypothetical protein ABSE57_00845 [Bryobacteraceae bacterium]|jgi:hypothetical protein
MAQHVKILGILHIVFGALGVFAAIVILMIFGGLSAFVGLSDHTPEGFPAVPILGAIGAFVFVLILVLSLPGLIIGIGLVQFRPWARMAGIILSALDLLSVPLGTALGVYGFWVLLNRETEQMFGAPPARVV